MFGCIRTMLFRFFIKVCCSSCGYFPGRLELDVSTHSLGQSRQRDSLSDRLKGVSGGIFVPLFYSVVVSQR